MEIDGRQREGEVKTGGDKVDDKGEVDADERVKRWR